MSDLLVVELWTEIQRLRAVVRQTLDGAAHPRCRELAVGLSADVNPVISLAFIGQYNAGKSSLIRALTGTTDVVVDANVATDRVVEVFWEGLRLIDTPGVRAGRPEHDDLTETAIAAADLIVFVVTAELFDATIAEYFRKIIVDSGRGGECLLVVNKSSQDAGTRETKLVALEEVLDPLGRDDVPIIFTDAQAKEWSDQSEDDEERQELLAESGFNDLVTSIDDFARVSGLRGQLTTPVYEALNAIDEAAALLSDDEESRASLELLGKQRSLLREHRRELNEQVRESIAETRNRIAALGDGLADLVEPETDPAALQAAVAERVEVAERYADELDERIERAIAETSDRMQAALQNEVQLALEFLAGPEGGPSTERTALEASLDATSAADAFPAETLRAMNQGLTKISTFFSQNARAGEKGHALVYGVGKKLGVKFRPWGAVKTARFLGRAAGGMAVATSMLELWNQRQQEKRTAEIEAAVQKTRTSLRSAFQMLATDMAQQSSEAFSRFLLSSYDAALGFVDDEMGRLVAERSGSAELLDNLASQREQLQDLLARVRGSVPALTAGQAQLEAPSAGGSQP